MRFIKENKNYIVQIFMTLVISIVTLSPEQAFAQTDGNALMSRMVDAFKYWPNFLFIGAYIIGIYYAITGLLGLKEANENVGRVPMRNAFGRLIIGGLFLAIGTTLAYITNSVEVIDAVPTGGNAYTNPGGRTLGTIVVNSMNNISLVSVFVSIICYCAGIFFAITALLMLQAWIEDPSKNPISKVFMRLVASGLLLSFPMAFGIVMNTVGGDSGQTGVCFNGGDTGEGACEQWTAPSVSGDGFDAILANIVNDIAPPLMNYGLPAFCYFVGIIFVAVCLYRLAQGSNDPSRAPSSMGTFLTLFVGAAFLSFAHMIAYTRGSLFDTGEVFNQLEFVSSNPMDQGMKDRAEAALMAVLVFLRIVGYISFARGLFILRAFGEGKQGGSVMGAATHVIAGGLLANLGMLLEAVQNTTGIQVFTFS